MTLSEASPTASRHDGARFSTRLGTCGQPDDAGALLAPECRRSVCGPPRCASSAPAATPTTIRLAMIHLTNVEFADEQGAPLFAQEHPGCAGVGFQKTSAVTRPEQKGRPCENIAQLGARRGHGPLEKVGASRRLRTRVDRRNELPIWTKSTMSNDSRREINWPSGVSGWAFVPTARRRTRRVGSWRAPPRWSR